MENQIYNLVNKLMEIFDVERHELGHQWAEQLISSVNNPENHIKPIDTSLDEIQSYRGDSSVRDLYAQLIRHNDGLRAAEPILHLASKLVADNNTRKFIRIHNILRVAKAKKHQQHQHQHHHQQHQHQQHQQQQQIQQQNHLIQQERPQQQPTNSTITSTPYASQTRQSQLEHSTHIQQTPLYNLNETVQQQTTLQNVSYQSSKQQNNSHLNSTSSMVAITPSTQRFRKDKSRRRKNDLLYQKMKTFLTENQFLSFDFKKIDWTQIPPIAPLSSMTVQEQESALINDLLYVLIGTEGKYIRMQPSRDSPNKHTIGVERGGDQLVYTSATRIIKICPLYSTVVHYAEDVNFGLVNQALGAPVRELVKEYLSLISNLQLRAIQNDLTLQSMWLSLQTIFYRMEALKQILDQISKDSCYGGNTLSVLHNRIVNFSTDPRTHEFCLKLMQAACEPYFQILERWLYLGIIEDPYGEFFVEDTENKNDQGFCVGIFSSHRSNHTDLQSQSNVDIEAFWRRRFTCDDTKVPNFLRSKQDKIFETGKYLSVVRQYGKKAFRPPSHEPLIYCLEQRKYEERVDEAYKFASKELLDLLLVENKLIDRLYSLKRYFLFSSGDFFVQFMDMADEELSRTKDEINMARLASLLELALRTSSCNIDPYKDDVHVKMSDGSLYQIMASINNTSSGFDSQEYRNEYCHSSDSLLGWESLTLYYDVPWPLSMVICKEYCQTLYQMMFRHLFCCKYIERKLEATWRLNHLIKRYGGAFALLRHKMLHFVHNLLFYITEIIEPSFQILISKFRDGGIENVNEVIELHRAFLSGLVHESMLTDNELLGHVTKLLLLCMDFSVVIEASLASDSPSNGDVFHARISEIDKKFETQIVMLLQALAIRGQDFTASSKLQNIFYRLDFNKFYSKNY